MIANRYRIDAEIGAGGMGTVYKGFDMQTRQIVAIKHLMPELANHDLIERFKREGEALRELNHPNIVKMLDAVEENGAYYLIIEYLSGGDLGDLLEEGRLPIKRVLQIAIEISDALTRAHHLNIIHRDLKPANILLAEDGTPRLTDFGVAFLGSKERVTATDMIVGTVDYIAPEVFNGELNDSRSDIWSFGVMLYEMLTGVRPFTTPSVGHTINRILNESVLDLEMLRPDIPVPFMDLIYRMLEKDIHARISSVRYVGAMLEDVLHGRDTDNIVISEQTRFATPAPDVLHRPLHNLPAQITSFVGRETEVEAVTRLINDTSIRLVTIVAQGGMGKTRLSLEVAAYYTQHSDTTPTGSGMRFQDGVYFVELAPLSDAMNIVPAIAEATGYPFQSDNRDAKQQILDYLSKKRLLLVMDNYEHILDGAALVTDILKTAPDVKVLATSRQRLNQSGETVFNLQGMGFPQWETPADALEYAAVKLFLQSARRAQPQFEVTSENMSYIARICKLVQGLPLGILLAASWLSVLQPDEIASEIAKGVDFLASDMEDLPERQRSIRAVFDYSWDLMTEAEQQTFSALSVFRGGFTREAAEAVADAHLRTLMSLVNKSLLRRNADTGRYDIHELLRQYAEEMLESAQAETVWDKYVTHYAEFVQQQATAIKGQNQLKGLNAVEIDFENIQAAWYHALKIQKGDVIQHMVEGVHLYCMFRSRHVEGERLFAEARKHWSDNTQPELLVEQLMVRFTGTREVRPLYERGLAIAQLHSDKREIAYCMEQLGVNLSHHSFDESGLSLLEQSRDLFRELGESFYVAQVLDELGWGYGLFGKDRFASIRECLALRKTIGDRLGTANALRNLASADWLSRGYETNAVEYLREAGQISQEVNDRTSLAWTKLVLGAVLIVRGEFEDAAHLLDEGTDIAFDIRVPVLMAEATVLRGLQKAVVEEAYEEALQLVETGIKYDNPDNPDFALSTFVLMTSSISKAALGDFEGARRSADWNKEYYYFLLEDIPNMAISWFAPAYMLMLDAEERTVEAIQLLSIMLANPQYDSMWANRWQPFVRMRQRLRQQLGDAAYEAVIESAKQLDVEKIRLELLDELRKV
jgi:serine/threonine protein kinase/tetratricopeptide (TPR) repeat protein